MSTRFVLAAVALIACSVSAQTVPLDLALNGGFETGDFTDWSLFPSTPGNITIGTPGNSSMFAGCINNVTFASASLIKNANVGVGTVTPGQSITISFDARGMTASGGVVFAEFFSEISGGGASKAEILGGAPLALDPNPNTWKSFSFTTTAGSDVTGGVTLQLAAITGAVSGSTSMVCFDNASIIIQVPVVTYPGSGDDLTLATGINSAANATDIKSAAGGDSLIVNVASPGATFDFSPYLLWVQLVPTSGGVPNLAAQGFPDIHLDLSMPVALLVDSTTPSSLGTPLIGPGAGTSHFYILPTPLNGLGLSLVFQSLVSSGAAMNNIYAVTNAHEITIP